MGIVTGISVAEYLPLHKAAILGGSSAGGVGGAGNGGEVRLLRLGLDVLVDGFFGGLLLVKYLAVLVVRHNHSV